VFTKCKLLNISIYKKVIPGDASNAKVSNQVFKLIKISTFYLEKIFKKKDVYYKFEKFLIYNAKKKKSIQFYKEKKNLFVE
jgi:hypothetical protein